MPELGHPPYLLISRVRRGLVRPRTLFTYYVTRSLTQSPCLFTLREYDVTSGDKVRPLLLFQIPYLDRCPPYYRSK